MPISKPLFLGLGLSFTSGLVALACSSSTAVPDNSHASDAGIDANAGMTGPTTDAEASAPDVSVSAGDSSGGGPLLDGSAMKADTGIDPCVQAGTCPPGAWTNVTPASVSVPEYGLGYIAADPLRASDLYIGGNAPAAALGFWKSTDYGNTWSQVNSTVTGAYSIAVAGTTPATVWSGMWGSSGKVYRSTDGGNTFQLIGNGGLAADLYSITVDPYDPNHLLSGLHEVDGIVESKDGGETWATVGGSGWPGGGISWYPFFLDTTVASTTAQTWFAIAQDGATPVITTNGGSSWTSPSGISGLQHPHGACQIYQNGSNLFVPGVVGPNGTQGVYRSIDLGMTWAQVDSQMGQPQAVAWGTSKNVYAMYSWACGACTVGTDFEVAPEPGATWSSATAPSAMTMGPGSVAVVNDGMHNIFVSVNWDVGIWRYIEP